MFHVLIDLTKQVFRNGGCKVLETSDKVESSFIVSKVILSLWRIRTCTYHFQG